MTYLTPSSFGATCLVAAAALAALAAPDSSTIEASSKGLASIEQDDIAARLAVIAAPRMEGRGSPSDGQARAADYITARFAELGLEPATDASEVMAAEGFGGPPFWAEQARENGAYRRPFKRELWAPDPEGCALALLEKDQLTTEFKFGSDFYPIHRGRGSVRGELFFGGFGIQSSKYKYDDFKGQRAKGKVVLIFEGEPRHKKKFEGAEVTKNASIWSQLMLMKEEGAIGALIVQRTPQGAEPDAENALDFRYTWASWQGEVNDRGPSKNLPALHISMDCATALLGTDARKLVAKMDKSAKPTKVKLKGREVSFDSTTKHADVRHDNLVGILRGSDELLREEYVLVGAHYDHTGVGPRGRIGYGANDNGSGVSALLEVAEALCLDPPKRSIIFASFTAEELGLFGSRALAANLPVPKEQIVCMINLDQIGFGKSSESSVLGTAHNRELIDVLKRAKKLSKTGIAKLHYGKREELGQSIKLFTRSDHYEFHRIGVPALFFFEGLPLSDNKDYHTWRDTIDGVDIEKVTNTARLVFNTVWILANDEDRPPPPRG